MPDTASMPRPVLEMQGIRKRFPGVQALDGVSLDLFAGEVHALVGENGAGKSTLMKILSGLYQPDEGQIILGGKQVEIKDPRHAQHLGISIVHQELSLFQNLTVAENILGGHLPVWSPLRLEDRRAAYRIAAEYLERFELPIDPRTPLANLSLGQQQLVEICKALAQNARLLILDEPTSSLAEHDTILLFAVVRQLAAQKIPVIYISHRLEEIDRIADRVTVLRDGQLVGTQDVRSTNLATIVRMMVGRNLELGGLYGQSADRRGGTLLEAENLSSEGIFENVSFRLHAGEILGMAGLIGAGRTEVALGIFGALHLTGGSILIDGAPREIRSPHDAVSLGIAYLPENRQSDGLFFDLGVRENISFTRLDSLARAGIVNQRLEAKEAEATVQQLNIQTPGMEERVVNLSGGNQQKVILGRWLAITPRVLIADEPTKGIDIGSKQEIYVLLNRLAQEGVGVILISSEMPEILGMSDRILVMHEGRLAGVLARSEATEEKIMMLATGQDVAPAVPSA